MKIIQHTAATCPGKPCSDNCDHKEFTFDPEHVTRIDRHNAPALHSGCIDMLCDNGALNRELDLTAAMTVILLPVHEASFSLARTEQALSILSVADNPEDWDTFFTGDETEALEIAARDAYLAHLHVILNLWFIIGMPVEGK